MAPCSSSNLIVAASGARNRAVKSTGKPKKSSFGTAFTSDPWSSSNPTIPGSGPAPSGEEEDS